jgi:hypothetical protein
VPTPAIEREEIDMDTLNCAMADAGTLERLRYYPRRLLTADDMRAEQEYFREKLRRHNRMLHGWGVVCGLEVVADPSSGPMAVNICPGYALGPWGDEIYVGEPAKLDLTHCARPAAEPCKPKADVAAAATVGETVLIVRIRYLECPTRPMRTLPAGCGCDETSCEYSRLRDGFEIACVVKPAREPVPLPGMRPNPKVPACLPCPSEPWIVLAQVTSSAGAITINNEIRRILPHTPSSP